MPSLFDTYTCVIICIATQLRQSGLWPDGTNMTDVAKSCLPKDFWDYLSSSPRNETKTIELTDDLSLELVKKSGKFSTTLKQKVLGGPSVTIAKWMD